MYMFIALCIIFFVYNISFSFILASIIAFGLVFVVLFRYSFGQSRHIVDTKYVLVYIAIVLLSLVCIYRFDRDFLVFIDDATTDMSCPTVLLQTNNQKKCTVSIDGYFIVDIVRQKYITVVNSDDNTIKRMIRYDNRGVKILRPGDIIYLVGNGKIFDHYASMKIGDIYGFYNTIDQIKNRLYNLYYAVFDYGLWTIQHSILGVIYQPMMTKVDKGGQQRDVSNIFDFLFMSLSLRIQEVIYEYVQNAPFSDRTKAMMLGIMLGDKTMFDDTDYKNLQEVGLVHIVAVSGAHIGLLIVLLSLLLYRIPLPYRRLFLFYIVTVYCISVGFGASVIRAYVFFVLIFLWRMFGYILPFYRCLSMSFIVLLCINPLYLLYDIGFQLSFLALFAIYATSVIIEWMSTYHLPKSIQKIVGYFLLHCVIGVVMMSFFLYTTSTYNIYAILGNIVVAPFIGLISISLFVGLLFYAGELLLHGNVLYQGEDSYIYSIIQYPVEGIADLIYMQGDYFANNFYYVSIGKWGFIYFIFLLLYVLLSINIFNYFILKNKLSTKKLVTLG